MKIYLWIIIVVTTVFVLTLITLIAEEKRNVRLTEENFILTDKIDSLNNEFYKADALQVSHFRWIECPQCGQTHLCPMVKHRPRFEREEKY